MKRVALFASLVLAALNQAAAASVVRIADGDCGALYAAAAKPPGQEPGLIVLATKGVYDSCTLSVTGNISIDGAGAAFAIAPSLGQGFAVTTIDVSGHLTLRNINLVPRPAASGAVTAMTKSSAQKAPTLVPIVYVPAITNRGTLTLDSVSMSGVSAFEEAFASITNSGSLVLRNVTMTGNTGPLISNYGSVEISQSTLAANRPFADGALPQVLSNDQGTITIANSILAGNGTANCAGAPFISRGGNVLSDTTCALNAASDRVIADAGLGDFGTHGGAVKSLALNSRSPAIGAGLASNCEATDARGAARGQTSCDAGAYEFGGGLGQLGVSGTSGLYFNSANNGHYVTVQRVFDDNALVIWNTFDQAGKPAWVYGVGSINGGKIHVDQVAENLGGVLHPGGGVSGVTPTFWGTLDLDFISCNAATLSYHSALPKFGSGTVNLERLAFVTGLDCSP